MRAVALAACAALAACQGGEDALPLVGTLERDRVEVVAEAREALVELAVSEGEAVAAGQLVARQDDRLAQVELGRARAVLDRAQARQNELTRGPRQEDIEQGRARLAAAEARLANDEREYARVADLVERKLASPSQRDAALAARDRSRAERREAAAALGALLEGTTVEELDQARAAVAEARAGLERAEVGLARLALRAPRAGVVDALPLEQGDRPEAGATVAVLLVGDAPWARVHVPAVLRARLRPGLPAIIRVDGVAGEFTGEVRTVASEPDFTPYYALTERDRSRLSYAAEVTLSDPAAARLPAGLPLEVDFPALAED